MNAPLSGFADANRFSEIRQQAIRFAEEGVAQAKQGQLLAAEKNLRQALVLLPGEASIAHNLARILLGVNRPVDALGVLDQAISLPQTSPAELLLLRAQTLLGLGRLAEAINAFEKAIVAAPENGTAELGLAMALGQSGQNTATLAAARRAIKKGADSAGARYVLGRALFGSYHFDAAEAEFRQALKLRPDDASAHASLAELVWMSTGDVDAATQALEEILRTNPRLVDLRITKARLLETAGKSVDAIASLELALDGSPNDLMLRVVAAQISVAADEDRALAHARKAVEIAPNHHGALAIYVDALFATGRYADAASLVTRQIQANSLDNHAIALLASAWRMLGDDRATRLFDYQHFVHGCLIDTPDGWPNLSEYLKDLAASLHRLHQLQAHPVQQTLRSGSQIHHELDPLGDPAINAFGRAIDGPIRRYMDVIGSGDDLFRRRNTKNYKLNGLWSVRLNPHGHHFNHFHGRGWLSSACYIELPEALGGKNGEGWLKFGEPGIAGKSALDAEYFIKPEPGLLVLFPSWMWHGTVPFEGRPEDRRLTMAFDVLPI